MSFTESNTVEACLRDLLAGVVRQPLPPPLSRGEKGG
jgi:hypothetical protein